MIIIAKESKVEHVFANYKNAAAFTTTPAKKGCTIADKTIAYDQLNFLPTDDDINAIKAGDKKVKQVVKKAVRALRNPKEENAAAIGINMGMLITAATTGRRNKIGPPVLVFILDDEDDARNKIIKKFLSALFAEFGLRPIKGKDINGVFRVTKKELKKVNKGRKKKDRLKAKHLVKGKVQRFENRKKSGCTLSDKGVELKKMLLLYYDVELRQLAANKLNVSDLTSAVAQSWAKSLVRSFTGENVKELPKKWAKIMAKKDRRVTKFYGELRDILLSMDGDMKIPKVRFGQKRKKGKAVGPKFKTKRFIKFFMKYRNRGYLMLVYGHCMLRLLGLEIGCKDYNQQMKIVCNTIGQDGFAKLYLSAAGAYASGKKGDESK